MQIFVNSDLICYLFHFKFFEVLFQLNKRQKLYLQFEADLDLTNGIRFRYSLNRSDGFISLVDQHPKKLNRLD